MWWWSQLDRIEAKIDRLLKQEAMVMATLSDITAAVTAEKTVEDSVVVLLQNLSAQLKAAIAANDPVAMQAIVDSINSNTTALASAVTANTP